MLDSFYKMYEAYRLRLPGQSLRETPWAKTADGLLWFQKTQSDVIIKVVGVFDTVNNVHPLQSVSSLTGAGWLAGISRHGAHQRGDVQQALWLP